MAAPAPAPALDEYLSLSLTPGLPLDAALQKLVDDEHAHEGALELSDDFTHEPAGLTPMMAQWHNTHVAPLRVKAIDEIKARFQSDVIGPGGAKGRLYDAEIDQLAQTKRVQEHQAAKEFRNSNADLMRQRDAAHQEFESLKATEGGREPVLPRPGRYWGGLAFILVLEFLLNLESFRNIPTITSPALAVGLTLVAAIALGIAGHIHGELLRQWGYWFTPNNPGRRRSGLQRLAIGLIALVAVLGLVAFARVSFIAPKIQEATILGVSPPSMLFSVLGLLLPNLLVYVGSSYWSYVHHDPNPDFVEKATKYSRLRARLKLASDKLNLRLKEIADGYETGCRAQKNFEEAQQQGASYALSHALLAKLQAQDKAVVGALNRYQNTLVKRLKQTGARPEFIQRQPDREDPDKVEPLTPEAWLSRPLQLKLISSN